jgi:hypothetical protein
MPRSASRKGDYAGAEPRPARRRLEPRDGWATRSRMMEMQALRDGIADRARPDAWAHEASSPHTGGTSRSIT